MAAVNIQAEYRLQGSVPLNVHIRGVSDVDLLILATGFYTYDRTGLMSTQGGHYLYPLTRTSIDVLHELRRESETALKNAFPAATVNTSGAKAIKIHGGSLPRPVDVVPAHWHDSVSYQQSRAEHDRVVTILDKDRSLTIDNWPFLHIKLITDMCNNTRGSLRKAIRLCKNIKADKEEDGRKIALSSFDIASIMYHANTHNLMMASFFELGVLAETQRHLDHLALNKAHAMTLRTPDSSRVILDSEDKHASLMTLSVELDELIRLVAKEHSPAFNLIEKPGLVDCRNTLSSISVPTA